MTTNHRYRIFCITQNAWKYKWSSIPLTSCPDDPLHDVNPDSVSYNDIILPTADIVVSNALDGNYTSIADAFNDGNSYVFVRNGTYIETQDIIIPDRGQIIGETAGKVVIYFPGNNSIIADGSAGVRETSGTISITNNTSSIVGIGTSFTNALPSNFILIGNSFYEIDSIINATHLTIAEVYRGSTIVNDPCMIQAMKTGVNLENFIIAGSQGTGLYCRANRNLSLKAIAINLCDNNLQLIDICDASAYNIVSTNSVNNGILIENCHDLLCDTCNVYNNMTNGMSICGTTSCIILDTCSVTCNGINGMHIADSSNCISVSNSIFKNNVAKGANSDITTSNIIIDSCISISNGTCGIGLQGPTNILSNCVVSHNATCGIQAGTQSIIQGNQTNNNGMYGIDLRDNFECSVSGNRCYNNTLSGIYSDNNNNSITGNICTGNSTNGIEITSTANETIVTNNQCRNNSGINYLDNGVGTISANNIAP